MQPAEMLDLVAPSQADAIAELTPFPTPSSELDQLSRRLLNENDYHLAAEWAKRVKASHLKLCGGFVSLATRARKQIKHRRIKRLADFTGCVGAIGAGTGLVSWVAREHVLKTQGPPISRGTGRRCALRGRHEESLPAPILSLVAVLRRQHFQAVARPTPESRSVVHANRAYAAGDEAKLRAILDDWQSRPESVEGEGIGAELVRIIRKIHQVERRLAEIAATIAELERLDLYKVKQKADAARFGGQGDLLAQMAEQVGRQIDRARMRLAELSMPGSIA